MRAKLLQMDQPAKVKSFLFLNAHNRVLLKIRAGADGYFDPEAVMEHLVEHSVADILSTKTLQIFIEQDDEEVEKRFQTVCRLGQLVRKSITNLQSADGNLTKREQECLVQILNRKQNKEIAESMFITVRTVKFHVSSLLRKMQCETRDQLVHNFKLDGGILARVADE